MTAPFPTAVVAIHGGAGTITRTGSDPADQLRYRQALDEVLRGARSLLAAGASALDVVVEAVRLLEECPLFNAGRGSVFTAEATHELDASVMRGSDLGVGAVAGVRHLRNPVLACRALLLAQTQANTGPVFLVGEGAERVAAQHGCELVAPEWYGTPERLAQLRRVQAAASGMAALDHDAKNWLAETSAPRAPLDESRKMGTVGAVALDLRGHLAAATSTGGVTNKLPGRVGDSPVVGAGTYADDRSVAVSCTGMGEAFIRGMAAFEVSALVRYAGLDVSAAASRVVHEQLPPLGGRGGLIAVDGHGRVVMPMNTEGMYRGWARVEGEAHVALFADEAEAPLRAVA